jgi:hypothetical protein
MTEKPQKPSPLEQNLLAAMKAIDNQILREMQRSPAELEKHGVQKWEPYQKRIENISALILNSLGGEDISLDSLLVLSQATSKALQLIVEELGSEGLGKMRAAYCQRAIEALADNAHKAGQSLKGGSELM